MKVGVLLLGDDKNLEFANSPACEFLGYASPAELRQHWTDVGRRFLDTVFDPEAGRGPVDFTASLDVGGRELRFHLEPIEPRRGYVLLVQPRGTPDALETDLRLATQVRSVSRLAGAMTHDVKAPLNAMVINLELLKETLEEGGHASNKVRQRQQRYVGVLRDEILRLDQLLRAFVSHMTCSRDTWQRFDLRELVREIEALLRPQATVQHVALKVGLPEQPVALEGYRARLKQAILNVAVNALEALPGSGEIAVTLRVADGGAVLSVRDSGPGIPAEDVGKVGTLHFTTKASGTGAGLFVARSVVADSGGTLAIESTAGTGTCVQITLPLPNNEA